MATSILWFRRDLRLHDNAAFDWACDNSDTVIPVYIHSPEEEKPWAPGAASRWWLHQSLSALESKLAASGLKLHFFTGHSEDVLTSIIKDTNADTLVYNRLYEQHLHSRDVHIEKALKAKLDVLSFDSGMFYAPGSILNNQQLPYRVFTPFYKKIRPALSPQYTGQPAAKTGVSLKTTVKTLASEKSLSSLDLLDEHDWHSKLHAYWQPGEEAAHQLLDRFLEEAVADYEAGRDIPSQDSTSQLSPYLHFGEITPRQILAAIWPILSGEFGAKKANAAEVFLKQLIWREFAYNVLWHFPETATQPMDRRYSKTFWRNSKADYASWTKGETGVPIVDAGMKQLWQTGWMHNRVRMIVSSFLTKNLGIHWLQGARWFWDTLVDADLANNSLGWQWVAGCGVDAAPYYRVFNPTTQTKRFDSRLEYIDTWLPEHADLDYPPPMVDLGSSREQALDRYRQYISNQN